MITMNASVSTVQQGDVQNGQQKQQEEDVTEVVQSNDFSFAHFNLEILSV